MLTRTNNNNNTKAKVQHLVNSIYRIISIVVPAGFGGYLLLRYRTDVVIATLGVMLGVIAMYNVVALAWRAEAK